MVEAAADRRDPAVIDPTKLQVVASVAIPICRACRSASRYAILVPGADEPEAGKVLTRPAAVDPSGVSADVRIAFDAADAVSPPARRSASRSSPNEHTDALAVPVDAVLHEDEDAFVMVAGADNKAHKRKVTLGLTTPKHRRDHQRAEGRART